MAAATLNRTRPFGAVSGDPQGRAFEQDHLFFTADGSLWVEPEPAPAEAAAEPAPKPAAKKGKGAAAPLAQDTQLDAQLGAA